MTMNQDNHAPGQDDSFASGEEFAFTEEKKPVNRNLLVLLLIAVVGGGAVYLMHLNKGGLGAESDATRVKSEQVTEFMKKGEEDLKQLDVVLQKMEKQVDIITNDASANQVKTEDLKTNPFQFEKAIAETPQAPTDLPMDPTEMAAQAANKAQISMITSSAGGSTCILNNKLCHEGDQITLGGVQFTVKQIAADFVLLQNGAGEFKATMKGKGL